MSRYLLGLVARTRVRQPAIRPPQLPHFPPPDLTVPNSPGAPPHRLPAPAPAWTDGAPARTPPELPLPAAAPTRPAATEPYAAEEPAPEIRPTPIAVAPTLVRSVPTEAVPRAMPPDVRDAGAPFTPIDAPLPLRSDMAQPPASVAAILRPVEAQRPAPRAVQPITPQQPGPHQPGAAAPDPAQTTYIHIGRVELHAAPPAVTIQRAAPKPAAHPHMSLDEYLRRRNGRPQ